MLSHRTPVLSLSLPMRRRPPPLDGAKTQAAVCDVSSADMAVFLQDEEMKYISRASCLTL